MINIIIPMAGEGSRFKKEGFPDPKPLIKVNDKHMIELVVNNIKPTCEHRFIFICQAEHLSTTHLEKILKRTCDNAIIISMDRKTAGAAETVLVAEKYINNDSPLMIANCDQWIDIDINEYLDAFNHQKSDGMIMTMTANDPKWSYLRIAQQGYVCEVREKEVISTEASVGIYNFKRGSDYCYAAKRMIEDNNLSNGEYYVAPTYNYLIQERKSVIDFYNIGEEYKGMYGLGIPTDLSKFLKNSISKKATDF
ncbi:NTP transferase domain-containing protein [Rosenbergiella australiborealis]|uniref:NTP transferase domain-containing protein n=1 Tax=Rosenbergiella australiborealis TaxID=1544696 RepID=A0ABS5T6D6_9GAMM|nr:glycosyltransferase family 2 protein [Rosenbergiella australiborealis]MBT0727909.1 NTP transferase domain-containing protein [Rosenbergiella australiborealis]